MRLPLPLLPALLAFACVSRAQDVVYYRFDDAYGTKAINYAPNALGAQQGTITNQLPGAPASSWVAGRFGSALAAGNPSPVQGNRVDTGWVPGTFTGPFSYALWIRKGSTPAPTGIYYVFGSPTGGAFRLFGSGTGTSLTTTGYGATATNSAGVYGMALTAWVHLAFVADTTAMTSTYYINGVAQTPTNLTVTPTWTSAVPFTVGQQLTTSPGSPWDIDEFLFTKRILTAAEIANMAARSIAGDAPYGGGCGNLTLGSAGGKPTTGNMTYQLTLTSPSAMSYAIGLGTNRASFGGLPLPFDLGTLFPSLGTCLIDSSLNVTWLSGAKAPGTWTVGLPVPANPALDGLTLFLQAPAVGGTSFLDVSNAFSIGIGN